MKFRPAIRFRAALGLAVALVVGSAAAPITPPPSAAAATPFRSAPGSSIPASSTPASSIPASSVAPPLSVAPTSDDPFVTDSKGPVDPIRLRLIRQTALVQDGRDGRRFSLNAVVSGADRVDRTQFEMAFTVYQRVRDRPALNDSINGVRLGSAVSIKTVAVGEPDSTGLVNVVFSADIGTCATCVPLSVDGVYPVSVEMRRRDDGDIAARLITHLILLTQAEQPVLKVALYLPVRLGDPPVGAGVSTTVSPAGARDIYQFISNAEALAATPRFPLSLSLTPSIVDLGRENPNVADTLNVLAGSLDRREIISGPYDELRPDIEGDPRLTEIVAGQLRRGEQLLGDSFPGHVTTATGVFLDSDALPRDGFATLDLQRMVVAESLLEHTAETPQTFDRPTFYDPGATTQTDGASTAISTVVADGDLASHLSATDGSTLGVYQLLADLSVIAGDGGADRGVAVALPSSGLSRTSLDILMSAIEGQPQLAPVTVSDLFDLPTATDDDGLVAPVTRRQNSPDAAVSNETAAQLDRTRRRLDAVGLTFTPPPPELEGAERLFSAGLSLPIAEATPAIEAASDQALALLSTIRLGGGGPFRLTALKGRIPLSLVNRSGSSATVVARLRSDRVVTQNGGRVEMEVDAAGTDEQTNGRSSSTAVAVATRSSGTFGVSVALETVNGIPLDREQLIITSTGVSGFGVALTVAALALLLLWWLRTRRANTANRLAHGTPRSRATPRMEDTQETRTANSRSSEKTE